MNNQSVEKRTSGRFLVSDLDGTLTDREAPLSEETADLLLALIEVGWQVVLLTGQHIENVKARITHLLRQVAGVDFPCLEIYTCEGANRWIYKNGLLRKDEAVSEAYRFSPIERRAIETVLNEALADLIDKGHLWVQQQPEWWEDAVLVFKLGGEVHLRPQIARELESRLNLRFESPLRVGVAGKTSLVIARADVNKRRVLEDIARGDVKPECIVYIADEFVPPGNDAMTLDVSDVVKVSVDEAQGNLPPGVVRAGPGPSAAHRWLKILFEISSDRILQSGDISWQGIKG